MRLLRNVRFDHLVGHVPTAAAEIASGPDMAPPKPFPQVWNLRQKAVGAFAFHPLDQATDGDVWRDGDHHMDMICRDMPLQNIDSRFLTLFAHNGAHSFRHFTAQHLMAILGDPDNMQVNRKDGVGPMAIVTHAPQSTKNLLKLPPKGVGFAPPNWRQ